MARRKSGDDLSHIIEPLRALAVDIDTLNLDPDNAREHDDESVQAIAASMRRFGQDQLVVVQKQGMVVRKGNGRVLAGRLLNWRKIAAIVVDEDDITAVARAVADNRSAELSKWSPERLGQALALVRDGGGQVGLGDVGFGDRDAAKLIEFAQQLGRAHPAPEESPSGQPDAAPAAAPPDADFVAVVFPMTPANRDRLLARLKELREEHGFRTDSDALLNCLEIV